MCWGPLRVGGWVESVSHSWAAFSGGNALLSYLHMSGNMIYINIGKFYKLSLQKRGILAPLLMTKESLTHHQH